MRDKDVLRQEGLDYEYTIRDVEDNVLDSTKSLKKALEMVKKIADAQYVEYEEFDYATGEPWNSMVVWGSKIEY